MYNCPSCIESDVDREEKGVLEREEIMNLSAVCYAAFSYIKLSWVREFGYNLLSSFKCMHYLCQPVRVPFSCTNYKL